MSPAAVPHAADDALRDGPLERTLSVGWQRVGSGVALAFAGFHIWMAAPWSPPLPDLILRSIHLGFAFTLCFLFVPALGRQSPLHRPSVVDALFAAAAIGAFAYIVANYEWIVRNPSRSTPVAIVFGTIAILLAIESCRRTIGVAFVTIVAIAVGYAWLGNVIPGYWGHIGFSWESIIESLFLSSFGLLGQITGISASIIAVFLIFGAFLAKTGGGETFIDLAKIMAGRSAGGPAKVSVCSSAFFGTISGSAVANVVVDGVFSIPLMKRMGYRPQFAAAVEATASTGGQMVPPIMGAGAFIMAELLGRPYWEIAVAAVVPAFLYYLGVFACVHLHALKSDMPPLGRDMVPRLRDVLAWRRSAALFGPIIVLLIFLARGYTPATATFWALATATILHLATSRSFTEFSDKLRELLAALVAGGRAIMLVATLVAAAGLIIGAINLTGIGIKFSDLVMSLGGGFVFLALILAMVLCIILGMGLPTTAAYVLAAAVVAPPIIKLGFEPLSAHLFIFYFAILSAITPPICPAVYVAAALARTTWVRSSFHAVQIGLAGFLVPFMFIYSPALLLEADLATIVYTVAKATVAVTVLSFATIGYLDRPLSPLLRVVLLAMSILLISPSVTTDVVGATVVAASLGIHLLLCRRPAPKPSSDRGTPGRIQPLKPENRS